MTQHTPGPWEVSRHGTPPAHPQFGIYADGGRNDHVIVKGDNAEADARLIVRAVNSHDALLAACEWFDNDIEPTDKGFEDWYAEAKARLRAAIAKAKGD